MLFIYKFFFCSCRFRSTCSSLLDPLALLTGTNWKQKLKQSEKCEKKNKKRKINNLKKKTNEVTDKTWWKNKTKWELISKNCYTFSCASRVPSRIVTTKQQERKPCTLSLDIYSHHEWGKRLRTCKFNSQQINTYTEYTGLLSISWDDSHETWFTRCL